MVPNLEALNPYIDAWMGIFLSDAGRYVVAALAAWVILWGALARPLRQRKIRPDRPPLRQLAVEFAFSLRAAFVFSLGGLSIWFMATAGWLRTAEADALGWAWGLPCLLAMIVAHDAYFYWTHRLLHRRGLFRWSHRRHHRSHNPSPFTAYSFDLAEALVLTPFVPLWVLLVPTSWSVVAVFMLHQIVRNVIGHAGYEIFPARADGRPLFDWLTTVTHHDLHHAQAGWNFGLYFTWWDRWMGTEHPEYHARFAETVQHRRPALATGPLVPAMLLMAGVLAAAGGNVATRAEPAGILGPWATPGLGSVVVIAPCADAPDTACGRIAWLWAATDPDGQPRTDAANPDDAARRNPLVGALILRGFTAGAAGAWTGGTVYNPDDGRSYSGTIRLLPSGQLELKGCALAIFCQSQYWRRPDAVLRELAAFDAARP